MNFSEDHWLSLFAEILASKDESVLLGPGDDAAVIRRGHGRVLLMTTDAQIEGVHFSLPLFSLKDLGRRAAAVNLSDIAAMAGIPKYALCSLAVPDALTNNIDQFMLAFKSECDRFGVSVIGGNLSASAHGLQCHVTLIGEANEDQIKKRSSAVPGDLIFVSGQLGYSHLGRILLHGKNSNAFYVATQKHLAPEPRVHLGQALARLPGVHALMDLSDGLMQDLQRMMQASGTMARVDLSSRPSDPDFDQSCLEHNLDPDSVWFCGGEDYELLWTADPKTENALLEISKKLQLPIYIVGQVADKNDAQPLVEVKDKNHKIWTPKIEAFTHFG